MKKIIDKRNMSQDDWQEYRKDQVGIGGSDVASILGIQPSYAKSAFTLWLEKTGQKEKEDVDNEFITWGNLLEPVIRKQFAKETGFKVTQNNFVLQHDEHNFMIANIDGEVFDPNQKGRGRSRNQNYKRMEQKRVGGRPCAVAVYGTSATLFSSYGLCLCLHSCFNRREQITPLVYRARRRINRNDYRGRKTLYAAY